MAVEELKCPQCGAETEQEEIDIGVGNLKRPPQCTVCDWCQEDAYINLRKKYSEHMIKCLALDEEDSNGLL